jgi:hypothetical protein
MAQDATALQGMSTTAPASSTRPSIGSLLAILLGHKLLFFALCFLALNLFPTWSSNGWGRVLGWPRHGDPILASHFAAWDGAHYLKIAETGYQQGSGSCAFYPLWPALIRLGSVFTGGNCFWSGIILANLLSILAFLQFHAFVREHHGPRTANWALGLLLAFPSAIFFNLIYTESLFLLLVVTFFRYLFRNQFALAGLVAFFLPMTKAIGIYIGLVLFLQLWQQKRLLREYVVLVMPFLGYLAYFTIMWHFTGNPFEGFAAQKLFPNQPSIDNLFNLGQAIRGLFNIGQFHSGMNSAVDRFHFLVVAQGLVLVWLLDKRYFAYAIFAGLIPAFSNIYWSYPRLMIVCFPIYIAFAAHLQDRVGKWILWYIVTLMAALQLYFIALYINFQWAS